jgi:hypothetical protein
MTAVSWKNEWRRSPTKNGNWRLPRHAELVRKKVSTRPLLTVPLKESGTVHEVFFDTNVYAAEALLGETAELLIERTLRAS